MTMNKNLLVILVLVGGLLIAVRPISAHHSTAGFDLEHPTTLKGTVTNFEWSNPHVYIDFDVKGGKGDVEKWRGELGSLAMLSRFGWSKHAVKPGDDLNVFGNRAKNGSRFLRITKIVLPDGKELTNNTRSEDGLK
jgi:hypothetical protein